jgi:2-polyprenyl-3-methyl-5-hydroxy-6-metoxy-1,4-benzoquinol methylase
MAQIWLLFLLNHLFATAALSPTEQIVQEHYETFPYPPPNYSDHHFSGFSLCELKHFLWAGRRNFKVTGLNVLIAGGGASSQTAVIASEMIRDNIQGSIVHLDLSQQSIDIAKQEAQKLGVADRINFVRGSLTDVVRNQNVMKYSQHQGFDFILSTGVVHHLKSPALGLASLSQALAPHGGMFIMVYGKYGRTGVYPLQEMFKNILPLKSYSPTDRLFMAKKIMKLIPKTHPFYSAGLGYNSLDFAGHFESKPNNDLDGGLYDLLLHSQDTPFTVQSILEMAKEANVTVVDFAISAKYDPMKMIDGATISNFANFFSNMERFKKFAAGEQLMGSILKHYFYAVRADDTRQKKEIHAGLFLRNIMKKGDTSLKHMLVCRPNGANLLEVLVTYNRESMVERLTVEGIEGWSQTWKMISGEQGSKKQWQSFYHEIPPLGAEIAAAIISHSNDKRCTKTIDILHFVDQRLDGVDLSWEVFGPQLIEIIQIGESLLQVVVEFTNN